MIVTELEDAAKKKINAICIPFSFIKNAERRMKRWARIRMLILWSDVPAAITNRWISLWGWCVLNPTAEEGRRRDENSLSGPRFRIPIMAGVREGSLNKDRQGREPRSVSIETVTCGDFEASPKAAGSVQPRVEFTLGENIFEFFGHPPFLCIRDKGQRPCKEDSTLKAPL